MNPDAIDSDADLLRRVIEGHVDADDAGVRALFARRPEWRQLAAACDDAEAALDPSVLTGASEEDRRLVAECLAAARRRPPDERRPKRSRFLGRLLIGLAAAALLLLLARAWLVDGPAPKRDGSLLGPAGALDCLAPAEAVPEFDSFVWSFDERLEPKGSFLLTVFALDEQGARGTKLLERRTRTQRYDVGPEERASWTESILWRIEVLDSNGVPGASCERLARRSPH